MQRIPTLFKQEIYYAIFLSQSKISRTIKQKRIIQGKNQKKPLCREFSAESSLSGDMLTQLFSVSGNLYERMLSSGSIATVK